MPGNIKELRQQRRRRLRKRHFKSGFVKCWNYFPMNSKGLYQSSGKEIGSCCMGFPFSTKHKIKHFHVVVVLRRLKNVQKSVMHVQSFCFTNLKLLLFCRSRSRRRCRWLCFLIEFFGRNDLTDFQREFFVDNVICLVKIGFEKRETNTK